MLFVRKTGGALYQDYGGILSVSGSIFENNRADGYGGAIFSGMDILCCLSLDETNV